MLALVSAINVRTPTRPCSAFHAQSPPAFLAECSRMSGFLTRVPAQGARRAVLSSVEGAVPFPWREFSHHMLAAQHALMRLRGESLAALPPLLSDLDCRFICGAEYGTLIRGIQVHADEALVEIGMEMPRQSQRDHRVQEGSMLGVSDVSHRRRNHIFPSVADTVAGSVADTITGVNKLAHALQCYPRLFKRISHPSHVFVLALHRYASSSAHSSLCRSIRGWASAVACVCPQPSIDFPTCVGVDLFVSQARARLA